MTVQNSNTSAPAGKKLTTLSSQDVDHLSIILRRSKAILATTGTEDAIEELGPEIIMTNLYTCQEFIEQAENFLFSCHARASS